MTHTKLFLTEEERTLVSVSIIFFIPFVANKSLIYSTVESPLTRPQAGHTCRNMAVLIHRIVVLQEYSGALTYETQVFQKIFLTYFLFITVSKPYKVDAVPLTEKGV